MTSQFENIGLIGKNQCQGTLELILTIIKLLETKNITIILEEETAKLLNNKQHATLPHSQIGKNCDLIIVIGGDGSLLRAARSAVSYNTPIVGVNRGSLGFLTDIKPNEIDKKLKDILDGNYQEERRFLLEAYNVHKNSKQKSCHALNEITIVTGHSVKMIEFEIYIDDVFMSSQRSDGIIIATPTGSTAYSLSAGGPILHPNLNAIVMVPMFSHTLSNRPIVINAEQHIKIVLADNIEHPPQISGDNQSYLKTAPGDSILIQKMPQSLRLIHPTDYDYFEALRSKLHWGKNL